MPLKLEEIEGYAQLMQLVETQGQKIADLERRLSHNLQQPKQRWTAYEANQLFIGKGGKPVERHTFTRMINNWLKTKALIPGHNYWYDGTIRFISIDFLRGQLPEAENNKLKRA